MKPTLWVVGALCLAAGASAAVTRDTVVGGIAVSTDTHMRSRVAIDSQNTVHMTYFDPSDESIRYTRLLNGSLVWTAPEAVSPAGKKTAPQTGMALNGVHPHVVYYQITEPAGVYHARLSGASWIRTTVDTFVGTHTFVSLAVGSVDNNPRVVYAHSPSSATVFGRYTGVSWSTTTIHVSSAVGPVDLALTQDDIPYAAFVSSSTDLGWRVSVASMTAGMFGGFHYKVTSDNIPVDALVLDVDADRNVHLVFHDPSVGKSSVTYAVLNTAGNLLAGTPFANPYKVMDTDGPPVFVDLALDSNDRAVIALSSGTTTDLHRTGTGPDLTRTNLETATPWTGVGIGLALTRYDRALVSGYTDPGGGGELRFWTDAPRGLSMAGTVSDFAAAAMPGVTMSLSGHVIPAVSVTDAGGAYSFGSLFEGYYQITPSFPGHGFTPTGRSHNPLTSPVAGQDFTGGPLVFDVRGNLMDPLKGDTVIFDYSVIPGPVRLEVYSLRGAPVKKLVDEIQPAGNHTVSWDGRDSDGRVVAAGIYLIQFQSEQMERKGKVAVVK